MPAPPPAGTARSPRPQERPAVPDPEPCGPEQNLTGRQQARLHEAFTAREEHVEVAVAWSCARQVRSAYHQPTHAAWRVIAQEIIDTFHACPIPEIARLGKTLRQWRTESFGYFDIGGASNGGTEAMNGLIELHRRVARGVVGREGDPSHRPGQTLAVQRCNAAT